jgi:hypothetical protein
VNIEARPPAAGGALGEPLAAGAALGAAEALAVGALVGALVGAALAAALAEGAALLDVFFASLDAEEPSACAELALPASEPQARERELRPRTRSRGNRIGASY